jgi:peptidoglycan/xylan/chitin deacetylase (PgdA/CDA1 family)
MQALRDAVSGYGWAQATYRGARRSRIRIDRWALALSHKLISTGRQGAHRGQILAYHSVGTPWWGLNDVTPRDFERHLQVAVDDGWSFATPAEVLAHPDRKQLALTFDDGPITVLTNAVPVLRHHGIPATAFIVTGWTDGGHGRGYDLVLDWDGVRALRDAGLTIGSHSVTHPDFGLLSPGAARLELEVSRERIRQMIDVDTDEFCIPLGRSLNWSAAAGQAAVESGYRVVYAQAANTRPGGTVPRTYISRVDRPLLFRAALAGAFDNWEEAPDPGRLRQVAPTP